MAEFEIARLGAQGDGIVEGPDGPLFVPYAAPGDRMRLGPVRRDGKRRTADIAMLVVPGPDRVQPPCPHFGGCGGCGLQHLAPAFLADWKRQRIVDALAQRGITGIDVEATASTPPASRRRLRLAARRLKDRVVLGFNARRSHHIVDVRECLIAASPLPPLFEPLRMLLSEVLRQGRPTDVQLTACDNGIDLWLTDLDDADPGIAMRAAEFADAHDLCRISAGTPARPVIERRRPVVGLSGVAVPLPPGGFLQASREGEGMLVERVREACAGATRIADLYAGLGTFSFALAGTAQVHAVEGDGAAVAAMTAARNAASGLRRIEIERRDLGRRPLAGRELEGFDAAVFDPPRSGAREQAEALARSAIPRMVAVSCEPATFARDARSLIDGGYHLQSVLPVDQFTWSPHVELVAAFTRG